MSNFVGAVFAAGEVGVEARGVIFDLDIDLPVRQAVLEKVDQLHRQLIIPVLLTAIADPDQKIHVVALEIMEGIDEIKGDSKCQSLNAAG